MAIAKSNHCREVLSATKVVPWQKRHADSKDLRRTVLGQKALQASNDPMLGYTELDGRHY
jgi:hypothetical protein